MKLKHTLAVMAAFTVLESLPAAAATLVNQDFSSNPPLCTTAASVGSGCFWYGAQHGVGGPSATFAWNSGAGSPLSGPPNGFVGYSPVNRAGVTFFTTGFTVPYGDLASVQIDARNSPTSNANQLAVRSGSQWYVSDVGFSATSGSWQNIIFNPTPSFTFQPYNTNGILPQASSGASQTLASNLPIDAIGIFNSWSGQNTPSSGFVLRYDNFVVTTTATVPEPATLTLLTLGLAGLGWRQRRRQRA